jgi:hypothetical protein
MAYRIRESRMVSHSQIALGGRRTEDRYEWNPCTVRENDTAAYVNAGWSFSFFNWHLFSADNETPQRRVERPLPVLVFSFKLVY